MPSTIWPPSIASAALNAPPSSSSTIAVSSTAIARLRAWSTIAYAAAQTLSAVPRSIRLNLRYAGTVGRWITPGPKTTGSRLRASARSSERIPPTPASARDSSGRTSTINASSRSPTSAAATNGRP